MKNEKKKKTEKTKTKTKQNKTKQNYSASGKQGPFRQTVKKTFVVCGNGRYRLSLARRL